MFFKRRQKPRYFLLSYNAYRADGGHATGHMSVVLQGGGFPNVEASIEDIRAFAADDQTRADFTNIFEFKTKADHDDWNRKAETSP